MKNYFIQYSFLVKDYYGKFWKLISLFIFSGLLDFIGIGLMGPFISLALSSAGEVSNNSFNFDLSFLSGSDRGLSLIHI